MFCLFCFDGEQLLLLQFRANTSLEDTNDCPVDSWVIPRRNNNLGCTLRYAFHRLLIQGFPRCQGLSGLPVSINGLTPVLRELFSGTPVFRNEGVSWSIRILRTATGAYFIVGLMLHTGPFTGLSTASPSLVTMARGFGILGRCGRGR